MNPDYVIRPHTLTCSVPVHTMANSTATPLVCLTAIPPYLINPTPLVNPTSYTLQHPPGKPYGHTPDKPYSHSPIPC